MATRTDWLESLGLTIQRESSLFGEAALAALSEDRAHRYFLAREWDTTVPIAVFLMLNPSTADAFGDDPTIRRCKSFAQQWGAGGLHVVNLFALRSPAPAALTHSADPVGPLNDQVMEEVLHLAWRDTAPVVAAWGVHGALFGRGAVVAQLAARVLGAGQMTCLGTTKDGYPRHPLYVRGATEPTPYPPA